MLWGSGVEELVNCEIMSEVVELRSSGAQLVHCVIMTDVVEIRC